MATKIAPIAAQWIAQATKPAKTRAEELQAAYEAKRRAWTAQFNCDATD